jgi:hypothetical protein
MPRLVDRRAGATPARQVRLRRRRLTRTPRVYREVLRLERLGGSSLRAPGAGPRSWARAGRATAPGDARAHDGVHLRSASRSSRHTPLVNSSNRSSSRTTRSSGDIDRTRAAASSMRAGSRRGDDTTPPRHSRCARRQKLHGGRVRFRRRKLPGGALLETIGA